MVWEINMGVCPRLDFEFIMLFNCLGYNFNIYGAFEFLCNSIAKDLGQFPIQSAQILTACG